MRKSLLFLLLTSAAVPAVAAADTREERAAAREAARAERSEARQERRAERAERAERSERQQVRSVEQDNAPRMDARQDRREAVQQRREALGERRLDRRADRQEAIEQRQQAVESNRDLRNAQREQRQEQRAERLANRRPLVRVPVNARPDIPAPPPAVSSPQHTSNPWRSSWRNDRRYDWRRYRDRNRWRFNLGFYLDPFGWNYRRHSIGWRLWPSYYSSSYWLSDPWMYRLPPAYGPYRWVRYHDDALLVNIYTGRVVDVIYSFFW